MKIAVLVASRNRPDLVERLASFLQRNTSVDYDLIVVECGTDSDKLTPHSTLRYDDPDFRGKCFGHAMALGHARQLAAGSGPYDYYWVLMNDLEFAEGTDLARVLVETMECNPRMAILSPTDTDGAYPGSAPRPGGGWRAVTTCDYLGFMMRARAVDEVGFLNPSFRYCWGAIHELSYHLYRHGWFVAYSDDVSYRHLGGSTYGALGTDTISREEYQRRAKRFAYAYFLPVYGPDWARLFWAAAQGHGIEIDTYAEHQRYWSTAFAPGELAELHARPAAAPPERVPERAAFEPAPGELLKIHLGCGPDHREGWLNVDVNPDLRPDMVSRADSLPTLADGCAEAIECCHLFEHLTITEARAALREWRRLLTPGGELRLELPDFAQCVRLIGTDVDGWDLGMIGLYGYPPAIDVEGAPQLHKWGWTPESLRAELEAAGFVDVRQVPITQTWRKAARYDRDMRLVSRVSGPAPVEAAPAGTSGEARGPVQRVFAWPRYADPQALDELFHVFARVLSVREDATLFLRHEPALDGPQEEVLAALYASHARVLGAQTPLELSLLDEPLDADGWRSLGERMDVRIRTAPADDEPPRDGPRCMATPVVEDAAALLQLLSHGTLVPARPVVEAGEDEWRGGVAAGADSPEPALVAQVEALHPWFYPVELGGLRVVPGVGTDWEGERLENRTARRATLLVDAVLERVDFEGRSLLDLACNCGYWSAHYVRAGARRLLGIEGRERTVAQAELYWGVNGFLPPPERAFLCGNVSDPATWETIRAGAPFDVTLCAGILYHLPNYDEVLRRAAAVTREVLILDTRVTDGEEERVREPGDLNFNAIAETREKFVPNRDRLLDLLRELGFAPEVLPVGFPAGPGVEDVDSYADGHRITVVARRIRAALSSGDEAPAGTGEAGEATTAGAGAPTVVIRESLRPTDYQHSPPPPPP